jgi:hypothetical protein
VDSIDAVVDPGELTFNAVSSDRIHAVRNLIFSAKPIPSSGGRASQIEGYLKISLIALSTRTIAIKNIG